MTPPEPTDPTRVADLPERIRTKILEGDADQLLQLFPPLDERDLEELRESIATRGIRVPVEIDEEGRLLDGHHRIQVARELELRPSEIPVTVRKNLEGEQDVLEYVLEINLGRRHLTRQDRAQVAAELRERGWSLRRIADRVGVHHETIRRDLEKAGVADATGEDDDGCPQQIEGRDGKTYPASRSSSCSTGNRVSPKRNSGEPKSRSNRSGSGDKNEKHDNPRPAYSSSPSDRTRGSDEPPDPAGRASGTSAMAKDKHGRIEFLNEADRLLGRARNRTPEHEAEIRRELEAIRNRCHDLVAEITGTTSTWVL